MIVTVTKPDAEELTTIWAMPVGSIGIAVNDGGHIYYRTMTTACCLDSPGASYSLVSDTMTSRKHAIRLLPRGTKVTLEVE